MTRLPEAVDPLVWARFAEDDAAAAEATVAVRVLPRQSSYHSQQAAEKALKSVLLTQGIIPPRTHDLLMLVQLLPSALRPPVDDLALADLTSWAIAQRYPGTAGVAAEEDALRSLATTTVILSWMRQHLSP